MTDTDDTTAQTGINAYTTGDTPAGNTDIDNPIQALELGMQLLNTTGERDNTDDQNEKIGAEHNAVEQHIKNIESYLNYVAAQGHTRSRVFTDWVTMVLAAVQGDEEKYDSTIEPYTETTNYEPDDERHPLQKLSAAMGELMAASEKAHIDILGDVYMRIGEQSDELGQHFTPHQVADFMASLSVSENSFDADNEQDGPLPGLTGTSVADVACGSGRLLMGMGRLMERQNPDADYWVYGVDLDPTCAKMAVLNLFLHGMDGVIVHGDSLKMTVHSAWVVRHTERGPTINRIPDDNVDQEALHPDR